MKAIILAAGRGSRMRGETEERPKCLVPVNGRSLLDYQLEALRGAGIEDIGIVVGYRGEMLKDRVPFSFVNHRWESTNMVRSLMEASSWLETDDCIVSYSDIFYQTETVQLLTDTKSSIAISYDPNWLEKWKLRFDDPLEDAETFRIGDGGQVIEIGNKPRTVEEVEGQYMGLLKFSPSGWQTCVQTLQQMGEKRTDKLQMTQLLAKLIADDVEVKGLAIQENWGEVDSPEDVEVYEKRSTH